MKKIIENWNRRDKIIGDVHPFFDSQKKQWMLFYLATDGKFSSRLALSKNMIDFVEMPLKFSGMPRAPYFVVAPLKHKKFFYTWFGQQYTHVCSKSRDGIKWWPMLSLDVSVNREVSLRGERDPYVVYDEINHCFYLVALSYPNESNDCQIILRRSSGDSLLNWSSETKSIVKFFNGLTWSDGEPECPQLCKIGHRWYLFTSLARKTTHHVGGMSYWIGDIDKNPLDIDWGALPRYELTSEDLCAAQVAQKGKQTFLFGWVPQEAHGSLWGGILNFPLLVKADKAGKLSTKFAYGMNDYRFALSSIENIDSHTMKKLTAKFVISGERTTLSFCNGKQDDQHIIIDRFNCRIFVASTPLHKEHASIHLNKRDFTKRMNLTAIFYDDVAEININRRYTLHAKLGRALDGDKITTSSDVDIILESAVA
ncbi:MAG TPA: hypothetical protein DCM23_02225 [Firmicutes bacterium]|nr:hypothetical protein [Bacillota bacterium]